jgi:hypothetical protein
VLRPTGSSNPADGFLIIDFRIDGDLAGVTSTAPLIRGGTYRILSGGSDNPDLLGVPAANRITTGRADRHALRSPARRGTEEARRRL